MSNPLNSISQVYLDQIANVKKVETEKDVKRWTQTEAKADTGTAEEKASARNRRNTPAGKDYKFDTSVFITRKPGESLDSARTRKRRDAHAAKRGVKESFSSWRTDLSEVIGPITEPEEQKEVKEKSGIKNKVVINPKLTEAIKEIGGELLEVTEYDPIEDLVDYFYDEGINEDGIDLIIEEIGLDEFVDFVDDSAEFLNEERSARRASVRAKSYEKVKAEVDKADAAKKKAKKGEYAPSYAKKETDVTVYDDKPAAKKKAAPKPVAKKVSKKDYDGDGKKETPKQEHRGVRNKKITKAVAKAKPAQPKKPASKEGLRAKIKSAYEAGVKRHRKATQPARVFHKGMKAGAKKAVKFAKDVHKAVSEEVGVSSSAAMEKARKEAQLKAKEDAAVAKKRAKAKLRASGKLKKHDEDGDGYVKVIDAGYKPEGQLVEKDLNAAERRALPDSDFVFPGKGEGPKGKQRGAYPIPDKKHARNALAMAAAHASPEKQAKVKAAVKKKFPGIKVSEDKAFDNVVSMLRKKHGEGSVITKDSPKPKAQPQAKPKPQKPLTAKEKAHREVIARYGGEANYKAGRGLGT